MSTLTEPRAGLGGEIRATLALALPLIAAQLCLMGQGVIEVMLAGHYDAHVLGAVAIGANLVSLPLMAIVGTLYAVPPAIAQLDGAGRRGEVAPVFRQAVWLAVALGAVMFAALRWGGPLLVAAFGVPDVLARDVDAFLRAVAWAMPGLALFCACRGLSDGLSRPMPTMLLSVTGLVLLLPIGWALMYGAFGRAPMGAAGTGTAAALVDTLQAAAYLAWLRFAPRYRGLGWGAGRPLPDPRAILGLLRVGVPMGVTVLLEVALFSMAALAIGRFGEVAAGAHQVALNVAALAFMVPLGLANAITVRVGNAVGRGDPAGVRRAGFTGMGIAVGWQSLSAIVMLLSPAAIASLYTRDAAVIALATVLLRLAGVFQLSDGLQVACNGALRGLKDTRRPMLLTLLAYWGVGMPLGLLCAFALDGGAPGMWIGLIAGLTTAAGLLFARFARLTRVR